MTDAGSALQRLLRKRHYARGAQACVEVLEGLGVTTDEQRVLLLEDVESLWPRYLARLRESSGEARRWTADESEAVQVQLDTISDAVDSLRVVWFATVDSEPVGVEVPAAPLLRAALAYFVTRAGDLMLVSPDAASGICVELNHLATGDEYEVVAWGVFAGEREASQP
jgi:hypothetical protein